MGVAQSSAPMVATIEDLLLEEGLLLNIFSHYIRSEGHEEFLRNIPRVCKRWNKLSSKASLWKDVTVCDPKFLQHLSQRGLLRNTQSLQLDNGSFSGMNLSPVLENIKDLKALNLGFNDVGSNVVKLVTKHCSHLQLLHLEIPLPTTSHELDQFLTVCGPTLKHLKLYFHGSREDGQQLVSGIAAKCPLLRTLEFNSPFVKTLFPIHKLRSGCPRMRELRFYHCQLINAERKDSSLGCGFTELKIFTAINSDFSGEDIYFLLKDSVDLEYLTLCLNDNLIFRNILNISSNKVRILDVCLKDPDENLKALGDAVYKWRRTLTDLKLQYWEFDVSSILKRYLEDNPNPRLESLFISDEIDPHFLKEFIKKCQDLIRVEIDLEVYNGCEEIEQALELLVKGENCA